MGGKVRPQSVDAVIRALAELQHGAVGRWQLIARGVTDRQIDRRLADGRLIAVHRGVYLAGHAPAPPLANEAAAILAFRGQATISHRSAAKLLGLLPWPPQAACWVITARGDSSRSGLIVRKATLEPCDITSVARIPVTTPARTILDCSAILPDDEGDRLETMWAEAVSKKPSDPPDLWEQVKRNPGKPGIPRLMKLLERRTPARPKRELERRLLRLIRSSDLPKPEVNAYLEGKERDLIWREQRVVVEADSYRFHADARTWASDIGKTNELQLLGYVVLRFTWFDVTERPAWVIAEIKRALTLRSA